MGTAPGGGPDRSFLDFFLLLATLALLALSLDKVAPRVKIDGFFHYFDSFEVRFGCRGRLMGEW